MPTTVQISKSTLDLLKKIKYRTKADSYNKIISTLAQESLYPKKSIYGFLNKEMKKISIKRLLSDLRDKHDRF